MMTSPKTLSTALACAAAALGAPLLAHTQDAPVAIPLDGEQVVGGVAVGCTGIGQEKDDPRWKAYPIRVEAADRGGDLLANMEIVLSGKGGAELARVTCAGPWIMLRPAPGAYRIEGWLQGGGPEHRIASVSPPSRGQRIVTLVFPRS
jgi:hypothetical protein